MSDQETHAQPPAAPIDEYSQPQPPETDGQPASSAAGRGRFRVWALVVVLLCVVAVATGVFAAARVRERGQARDAIASAEAHYNAATVSLSKASESMTAFGETGDEASAREAARMIDAARDELGSARSAIGVLSDSVGKRNYIISLDRASESVDDIDTMVGTVRLFTQASGELVRGAGQVRSADALLDAAIKAGNSADYPVMKAKGRAAAVRYGSASEVFSRVHKQEPAAGLDVVVDYVKAREQQANLAVRMASYGESGLIAAYNKLARQLRSVDARVRKIGQPAIVSDASWFEGRVAEQQKAVEESGSAADEYRSLALEQLGYVR